MNVAYNMDCMEYMKTLPDKAFDLAVVDPPYGIERLKRGNSRLNKYGSPDGAWNNVRPTAEYFNELLRVSKRVVIWGGNYFELPPCRCFVVWYKHQPIDNYSDCEFAWTNIDAPARVFDYPYFGTNGADTDGRIHPTQKPVALYAWIFRRYANPGDKILDTHLGSGSSRIAAYDAGLDFVGCEIDPVYFRLEEERWEAYTAQTSLFES